MVLAWSLLVVAVLVEVVSTALLPRTDGFRHLGWSITVLLGYGTAIWMLSTIVRTLPVSVAYAVWSGLGTATVAVIAVVFLGEQMTVVKAACLGLIVVGVVGLQLTGSR